jgi:nitroimidazol reductase NimA-like FMN-containing flavoprotein (pyridoxamine 5'-phosphate oxidase superfamily)
MRRKDREIDNREEIRDIIKKALFCNVAMCRNNVPYLVPMNFGFDGEHFYLHSAPEGLKIDILKENPQVCIEITQDLKINQSTDVCKTSMKYNSVIVFGRVEFLSEREERIKALTCIVEQLSGDSVAYKGEKLVFNEDSLNTLTILKVYIEKITGKRSI